MYWSGKSSAVKDDAGDFRRTTDSNRDNHFANSAIYIDLCFAQPVPAFHKAPPQLRTVEEIHSREPDLPSVSMS